MIISEMIKKLELKLQQHGDLELDINLGDFEPAYNVEDVDLSWSKTKDGTVYKMSIYGKM